VRLKYALFVLLFTTSYSAQEEPLPVVSPRPTLAAEVMLIATAVEPIREFRGPTLAEAARHNDYAAFEQLYREAKQRGEPVAQFDTLHELWVYSMTNPIGAFYGQDMYERLARAYPGYARFIDQYRIVDSRGNVFYPTSETREFVLDRAVEGRSAQRVLVAENTGASRLTVDRLPVAGLTVDRLPVAGLTVDKLTVAGLTVDKLTVDRKAHVKTPAAVVHVAGRAPAPAVGTQKPAAVIAVPPSVAKATPLSQPVPVATRNPQPATVPTSSTGNRQPSTGTNAQLATTPTPSTVNRQPSTDTQTLKAVTAVTALQTEPPATSRGLLLIVIGLLGVGLLAVMFRTPQESLPPIIDVKPSEPTVEKPAAPVEPLRRPEGAQRAGKNRANGSRG
jgi:hypothetical protein